MSAALKRTYVSVIHAEQVRVSFMGSKKGPQRGPRKYVAVSFLYEIASVD